MHGSSGTTKLTAQEFRSLRGAHWVLNGEELQISADRCGQSAQAMIETRDAVIIPLLDCENRCRWFLKVFVSETEQKQRRAEWLIAQELWRSMPELTAAPRQWIDTRDIGRPAGASFDFAGYLAAAVPGTTWCGFKSEIQESGFDISVSCRLHWVKQLLRATAMLERHGLVHGDLSENNIVIDRQTGQLTLIDFDGFVALHAPEDVRGLSVESGGTAGTDGYMPVDLERRQKAGEGEIIPYSDRRARDMLILELLCFDAGCCADPASTWDWKEIADRLPLKSLGDAARYFDDLGIIDVTETQRLSSSELAGSMKIGLQPAALNRFRTSVSNENIAGSRWFVLLRNMLWSLSVFHWILLGFAARSFIVDAEKPASVRSSTAAALAGWIMCLGVMTFGIWLTTRLAITSEFRSRFQLGSIVLHIAPYSIRTEVSPIGNAVVLTRLAVGTLLLAAAAVAS
ncbi:phosphotransferase [bacterium]|nr:phosphotransferase [bacterium]